MIKLLLLIGVLLIASVQTQQRTKQLFAYEKGDWYSGMELCHLNGYELVSMTTRADYSDLIQFILAQGWEAEDVWTSGNDHNFNKVYAWMSNGIEFNYTNWGDGEPNNTYDTSSCVYLSKLVWRDGDCTDNKYIVCEKVTEVLPNP